MTTEWDKVPTNGICGNFIKENPAAGAPCPIDPATGQHKSYWVLPEEERAKGFVRPVRRTYLHVGRPGPRYPLRDLTDEEKERFGDHYAKFEEFTDAELPRTGFYWKQEELDKVGKGCQTSTSMSPSIAETYARNPQYYGATFCVKCGTHLPVGEFGEFVWEDGSRVGS